MLSKSIQEALNKQVQMEAESSQAYLAMASWCEIQPGLEGVTEFLYKQSDEERAHMLKLIRFVNERGGFAAVPGRFCCRARIAPAYGYFSFAEKAI